MTDVRDELIAELCRWSGYWSAEGRAELADAILERFDVTPKSVITEQRLGEMVAWAIRPLPVSSEFAVQYGENMFRLLDDAGLEIVRKEAGE